MTGGAIWLVGGIDPSGGGGILRDVATVRALAPELVIHTISTALTQQGDGRPAVAAPLADDAIAFQFERAPAPVAVKIGLVPAVAVAAVAEGLGKIDAPRVLDPVLRATAGGRLAVLPDALRPLLSDALVTPNAQEYERLIGDADPQEWLERTGARAVLRKGGDDGEPHVSDTLWTPTDVQVFSRPRVDGPDPRGTGCALASAIAARLALGSTLPAAVARAIAWLDNVRARARSIGGQVLLP